MKDDLGSRLDKIANEYGLGWVQGAEDWHPSALDHLIGRGVERYQLWPERLARSAFTLPHDVATGDEPLYDTEAGHITDRAVERTADLAGLVNLGALPASAATAGLGRGSTLGSGPISPKFYSVAERAAEGLQPKSTAGQYNATLSRTPGVKPEELELSGIGKVAPETPMTRDQLVGQIREGTPKLEEKILQEENWRNIGREDIKYTKYDGYTLPGGENYREVLLTLPPRKLQGEFIRSKGLDPERITPQQREALLRDYTTTQHPDFTSSHWDEPNVVAHLRMNDRTLPDGERVLFAEELQSDWHQKGRREGYQQRADTTGWTVKDNTDGSRTVLNQRGEEVAGPFRNPEPDNRQLIERARVDNFNAVPDAPFKRTWPDLLLKRMAQEGAEKGYDAIAWTDGATQAARYDLSKKVSHIDYRKTPSGDFELGVVGINGEGIPLPQKSYTAKELPDIVGKEVADKIVKGEGQPGGGRMTLRGLDLQVGGEGMRAFYDRELPRRAEKLFGKWGGG